eukprot:403365707
MELSNYQLSYDESIPPDFSDKDGGDNPKGTEIDNIPDLCKCGFLNRDGWQGGSIQIFNVLKNVFDASHNYFQLYFNTRTCLFEMLEVLPDQKSQFYKHCIGQFPWCMQQLCYKYPELEQHPNFHVPPGQKNPPACIEVGSDQETVRRQQKVVGRGRKNEEGGSEKRLRIGRTSN